MRIRIIHLFETMAYSKYFELIFFLWHEKFDFAAFRTNIQIESFFVGENSGQKTFVKPEISGVMHGIFASQTVNFTTSGYSFLYLCYFFFIKVVHAIPACIKIIFNFGFAVGTDFHRIKFLWIIISDWLLSRHWTEAISSL